MTKRKRGTDAGEQPAPVPVPASRRARARRRARRHRWTPTQRPAEAPDSEA